MTTKTWRVVAHLIEPDLVHRVLSAFGYVLQERAEPSLGKLLSHPKYAAYQSACEPKTDARELAAKLGRSSTVEGIPFGIEIGDVQQVNADGTTSWHRVRVVTSSINIHSAAVKKYTPDQSLAESERKIRDAAAVARGEEYRRSRLVKRAVLAIENSHALEVMELLKIEEPTPTQLGHIVDLVREACGSELGEFSSKNQLTRFERSINHREVMGLAARHAVSNQEPPPRPMRIAEARAFARGIGETWLARLLESD